ncbi:MAG: hypothetical protein IH840_03675 [Candidatus Heimdallarchaeota archaeon]|nr:hypothetical protein [Candidatus Heimdallarchaeota archaeon]
MRISHVILTTFLISLVTLTPMFDESQEIIVIQNTPSQILLNVHSPTIILKADFSAQSTATIWKLNLKDNSTELIYEVMFFSNTEFNDLDPGWYIIEILSSELGLVTIEITGVYPEFQIILVVLLSMNIVLGVQYVREYIV